MTGLERELKKIHKKSKIILIHMLSIPVQQSKMIKTKG